MKPRIQYQKAAPAVFNAMRAVQNAVNAYSLEPGLMELIKIRASQINGCAFCLAMHTCDAVKLGMQEQRIYQLDAWRDSPLYSEREQAALEWTEAITRISHESVNDAVYGSVHAQFSDMELVQLTLAIIAINSWNRLNIAFRVPPQN